MGTRGTSRRRHLRQQHVGMFDSLVLMVDRQLAYGYWWWINAWLMPSWCGWRMDRFVYNACNRLGWSINGWYRCGWTMVGLLADFHLVSSLDRFLWLLNDPPKLTSFPKGEDNYQQSKLQKANQKSRLSINWKSSTADGYRCWTMVKWPWLFIELLAKCLFDGWSIVGEWFLIFDQWLIDDVLVAQWLIDAICSTIDYRWWSLVG